MFFCPRVSCKLERSSRSLSKCVFGIIHSPLTLVGRKSRLAKPLKLFKNAPVLATSNKLYALACVFIMLRMEGVARAGLLWRANLSVGRGGLPQAPTRTSEGQSKPRQRTKEPSVETWGGGELQTAGTLQNFGGGDKFLPCCGRGGRSSLFPFVWFPVGGCGQHRNRLGGCAWCGNYLYKFF